MEENIMNEVREMNNYRSNCGALYNDDIYFYPEISNVLMKINISDGKLSLTQAFDNHILYGNRRADYMCAFEDSIYAVDENGEYIEKFDLKNKKADYVNMCGLDRTWGNFAFITNWEGKLYLFPMYKLEVYSLDMRGMEKVNIQSYKHLEKEIGCNDNTQNYITGGCQCGERVLLYSKDSTIIVNYDLKMGNVLTKKLEKSIEGCLYAVGDASLLYILTKNYRICCWDILEDKIEEWLDLSRYTVGEDDFEIMDLTEEKIIVLPKYGEEILIINRKTKHVDILKDYPKDFIYTGAKDKVNFVRAIETDDCYYHMLKKANYVLKIDKKNGETSWCKPIFLPQDEKVELYRYSNLKVLGNETLTIDELLGLSSPNEEYDIPVTIGHSIWNTIKKA